MSFKKITSTHLIFLLSILVLTSSCRKSSDSKNENYITSALTSKVDTLDPAVAYDAVSGEVIYQVYETLFEWEYLKRPYQLRPLLADNLPLISNGGTKYTFKIRKNILYHDHPSFNGKPREVKAADFLNAIKRQAFVPTRGQGLFLFEGKIKGVEDFKNKVGSDWEKFKTTDISGFKIIDDHSFSLELYQVYPQILYAFAMAFSSPIPLEVLEHHQNNLNNTMVGTGPFYLKENHPGHEINLERFPGYKGPAYPSEGDQLADSEKLLSDANKEIPFIKGIHFKIQTESNTRWLNFQNQNLDFIRIPKDNFSIAISSDGTLSEEMKKKNIKLNIETSLTAWWLAFNMKDPVWGKNLKLRQAISHAIDIDRFIELFTNKVGMKANSLYMPGVPGYNPTQILPYTFNLERAKNLLEEAGFPNGKGLPELVYDSRNSDSDSRQIADYFRSQLEKIGINVKIEMNSFPGFLEKMRNGQLQFWMGGWTYDYPDSENLLQLLITRNSAPAGVNDTLYSNSKVDALFEKLKLLPNEDEKFEIMKEIENEIHHDLPWVMLYYRRSYSLYHGHLQNFRPSDLVNNFYKYLRMNPK